MPSGTARRPVYPYSVVPGGVQSKQELLAAIHRDSVVARHYSGIDVGALREIRLDRESSAYVSFRLHERVYWTSRKVKLAAGETIFQAKDVGVRARCGNQVSDAPQSPVLPTPALEPAGDVLDTPTVWETAERQVLADPPTADVPASSAAIQPPIPAPGVPVDPPTSFPVWNGGNWMSAGAPTGSNGGAPGGSAFQPPPQPSIPTQPTIGPVIPSLEIFPAELAPITSGGLIRGSLPVGTAVAGGIPLVTLAYAPPPYQPGWTPIVIPIPIIQVPTGAGPNDPGQPPVVPPPPPLPPDPQPLPPVTTHVSFTNQPPEQAIPEPATWVLGACGLFLVFISRIAR